jgi:hypothetical protein
MSATQQPTCHQWSVTVGGDSFACMPSLVCSGRVTLSSCLHDRCCIFVYSGWRQLCVHAQPCMQGPGDAACLLCMLGAVLLYTAAATPRTWACGAHHACMLCQLHAPSWLPGWQPIIPPIYSLHMTYYENSRAAAHGSERHGLHILHSMSQPWRSL